MWYVLARKNKWFYEVKCCDGKMSKFLNLGIGLSTTFRLAHWASYDKDRSIEMLHSFMRWAHENKIKYELIKTW